MLNKGDEINNYTLEKYLGKGSYGEVWLAKKKIELSDDGILVALKFLAYQPQKGKAKEDFIKQVRREVGTWIKSSGHKNIVSVQDGFVFREDTFVIVSDFAAGGSLGDWLQDNGRKSPNLEKTVEIMSEILEGLTHLHSQSPDKIIHRDLKPDNVLFKSGVPCITDFGVSRMSQTITKSMAQVAATSAGTPLYMSPESFNNQPASRSMDIWSAGVILYQMLSGAFPYYSESIYALGYDIISKPPKPLPADVPREFQAVVAKSLARDISQRFQTAEEMKADLKKALKIWRNAQDEIEAEEKRRLEKEEQKGLKTARLPREREESQPQPDIDDTIIDEDFDKTELLEIPVTKDWQAIEAEKQRQREKEETARIEQERIQRENEEQQRLKRERLQREAEAKRIEREKEENLRKQKEAQDASKWQKEEDKEIRRLQASKTLRNYGLGIGGGIIGIILLLIWMNTGSTVSISNSNSANNTANKPANIASNRTDSANKATNTANSSTSENFKNSIGMEFVKIPSGSFMMGSDKKENEKPIHKVTISQDFWLQKTEVTQSQWQAVMGNNPSNFKGDNLPVETVSWDDAQEFIKKLNAKGEGAYRLPTEAEWEYAARAGTTGDYAGNLDSMGWYYANSDSKTHPVGTKQANAWGLYDMHGNVWEWCQDWYGDYPSGAVTNPTGAASGSYRVDRGGSWYYAAENLRSADRSYYAPSHRNYHLGFRLLRN